MSKRIPVSLLILPVVLIIVASCAKVSAPTGGRRDRVPPVVVTSNPANRTVNFNADKVEITFNEYVVLDNINDKFMVSPPLKKRPVVEVKKKSVVAEFDEELRENTTYTFYFQDAIKDLNEGNILENYQFVFSTGPVVDSLSVTGNVFSSLNLEVPEKTIVLLYRDLQDSAVNKQLPDYISMVDATGYFRIENVREGNYRLYALKDADNSKNYNLRDEEFAFLDSVIAVTAEHNYLPEIKDTTLTKTQGNQTVRPEQTRPQPGNPPTPPAPIVKTGEHQMILFAANKTAHYLTSSNRTERYRLDYTLSLPPDSLEFGFSIPEATPDSYIIEKTAMKDTITVWLTDSSLYAQPQITTLVTYPFTDTLGITGYKNDTILMRFLETKPRRETITVKPPFSVNINIMSGSLKPGHTITFNSKTPFKEPDTTKIRLYEILDSSRVKLDYRLVKDSTKTTRYIMQTNLAEKKQYFFTADSAAFGNIYNDVSDSLGIKFVIKDPDSYSKLSLNISNYEGNLIVQLMDKAEKLLYEKYFSNNGKIEFPLLETGFYRIRVIYDLNGDGKWTTGEFESGRQPEPVSYYPAEIEMKAGWQAEQDWDLSKRNFKDPKLRTAKKGK